MGFDMKTKAMFTTCASVAVAMAGCAAEDAGEESQAPTPELKRDLEAGQSKIKPADYGWCLDQCDGRLQPLDCEQWLHPDTIEFYAACQKENWHIGYYLEECYAGCMSHTCDNWVYWTTHPFECWGS
jgi:hypothetical protein